MKESKIREGVQEKCRYEPQNEMRQNLLPMAIANQEWQIFEEWHKFQRKDGENIHKQWQ